MEEKRKVTQNDVAREAGVTRSIVSYVISGSSDRSVAPETRKRILEVIDRLGYRPNKAAQALQQGNEGFAKNQIGLVISSVDMFRSSYYAEIIAGIHTAAHEHKYHVHFIRFFHELKDPVLFNQLIHPEEIGSLILLGVNQSINGPEDYKIIDKIRGRIEKIVCLEWKCEGLSSVIFDRQETGRKAAEFLFYKGYEDIGYIGVDDDRLLGVQTAFLDEKKSVTDLKIYHAARMADGYSKVKELHKQGLLPRAIVFGSDEVAIGAMCYLNENKIGIPDEVAFISIDNIESSSYTTPALTTMNVQKTSMGVRAVEMIVNNTACQGENALNISLPTNLVERQSC